MCPTAKNDSRLVSLGTVTILAAITSALAISTAFLGDDWLRTEERMSNYTLDNFEGKSFFMTKTRAGFFKICKTNQIVFKCSSIKFFPPESYSPDTNDASDSIPYVIVRSAKFYFFSITLLFASEVLLFVGFFWRNGRIILMVAAVLFVISGCVLMLGTIVFIATLQGETAEKLKPQSTYDPPKFSYEYGSSFILILLALMSEEVCGVSAVFLFIYWHKADWSTKTYPKAMTFEDKTFLKHIPDQFAITSCTCSRLHFRCLRPLVHYSSLPSLFMQTSREATLHDFEITSALTTTKLKIPKSRLCRTEYKDQEI